MKVLFLLITLLLFQTISLFAQDTPAPSDSTSTSSDDGSSFGYTPGVVFVDLVYTLTTAELLKKDPINNDHLFRVNLARSGYRGESLSVNFALPTIDLANYRKNSSTIISSNAEGTVPIYDNVLLMLYCDSSKFVDEYGILQTVPPQYLQSSNFFTGDASSTTSAGQTKNSFLSVNYCNMVDVYLKLPSTGASRVQWLFQKVDAARASSSDLLNFTETNHRAQLLKGDLLQSFAHTGWQRILWGEKYCRDVIDECMFHAFSCSSSYQKTKIVDHSEAFPVYNLGYPYYPATEFRNLWTAISSPSVAEIMPSEADLANFGPFGNRMSASFINLENNAMLMTINRLPPSRVLEVNEAFEPSDQATILMQLEAQPSSALPEAFVTGGTMFAVLVCAGVCLFLIICKAIVPRILYLRKMESEGEEEALERVDNELIERFEQQRLAEENRNALIARLGRVTGAPLTPDDVEALEDWTKLPVGDMIQASIVEERKRAMQEKLASATDKFAALPRVLFARALRLVDKSLFSRTGYEEAKAAEVAAEAEEENGEEQQQQQQELQQQQQQLQNYNNIINNNNNNNDPNTRQNTFASNDFEKCDTASSSPRNPNHGMNSTNFNNANHNNNNNNNPPQEGKPNPLASTDAFTASSSFSSNYAGPPSASAITNSFSENQIQRTGSMVLPPNLNINGKKKKKPQTTKNNNSNNNQYVDPIYDECDNIADADLFLLVTDATKQAAGDVKDSVVHVAGTLKNGVVMAATGTVLLVETGASKVVEGGALLRDKVLGGLRKATNNTNPQAENINNANNPQNSNLESGFENPISGRPHNNDQSRSNSQEMEVARGRSLSNTQNGVTTLDILSPEDRRLPNGSQAGLDDEIVEITPNHNNNINNNNPHLLIHEGDENDGFDDHNIINNKEAGHSSSGNSIVALTNSSSVTTVSSSTHDLTTTVHHTPQMVKKPLSIPPLHTGHMAELSLNGHNISNFHFHSPTTVSGLTLGAAAGASPHHTNEKFFEHQVAQQLQKNALNTSGNLDNFGGMNSNNNNREKSTSLAPGTVVQMNSQRRFRIAAAAAASVSGNHRRSMSTNSNGGAGAGGGANRRGNSMSPGMTHNSPAFFEDVLERHLMEDRRLLDNYKDELLPSHSFDIFNTETRPDTVPHCRRCGDVLPFVDLFAPCNCTSTTTRYIHRSCLEAERRLDAFAEGGKHAEFCFRCRVCRAAYRVAPNSISVFGAVPMKSPLAQTINKLLTNPVAPMLAMWVMVWVCGYLMKFVSATLTLDYINTDWSALRIYHWVLGAFFLLSFSLCEWSLRPFFEVFSAQTRRIIVMAFAAFAPLLFGFVGHFCMKLVAMIAWSWESFFGLGVVIELLLFAYVVPKILLFLAKGAGSLYDRLPLSVQRLLQKIVP